MNNELKFFMFWKELIFNPKNYFKDKFQRDKLPYLGFVILVFGMAEAINKTDAKLLTNAIIKDQIGSSWINYWIFVTIVGLISGYCYYLIGGWFYNLRVKWSQGETNMNTSRFLYTYSMIPVALCSITTEIYHQIIYQNPLEMINPDKIIGAVDKLFSLLSIGLLFYSIYISFTGVKALCNVNISRAKIWFLYLPCAIYLCGAIIVLIGIW